ncbi:uncharacterized protein A4U43_C01F9410 [Asparagus officinalis]|uniref:Uncharacterized protein n=1 Tax=Asparagus officinalis TaxID=4686 RepID=A0A5P1FNW5_ASPOF|nr:uncharacterized protein A4U43_C01F9410 [Asparagus officinalis]
MKRLREVVSLRVDQEAGLERAAEMPALSALEVDSLKQQLEESEKMTEKMEEVLRKRDRAEMLAKSEKEAAVSRPRNGDNTKSSSLTILPSRLRRRP